MKNKRGITLIALIITIIVLLILAGVSISLVVGENGILNRATDANKKTNLETEKEYLELATVAAYTEESGYRSFTLESLSDSLDNQFGKDETTATENPDGSFTVKIKKSKNEYQLTSTGAIINVNKVKDETPAFLAGEGTEGSPYLIESIEDLVFFSYQVREGIENYEGKYVELTADLNFASSDSYVNPNSALDSKYGYEGSIKDAIDKNGFIPIGSFELHEEEENRFKGIFDGKYHKISNVNINSHIENNDDNLGIGFFSINSGTIKNLKLNEKSTINFNFEKYSGIGILAGINTEFGSIINCIIDGNIGGSITSNTGMNFGGIAGASSGLIKGCVNNVNLELDLNSNTSTRIGGICGSQDNEMAVVKNCYNCGTIKFNKIGFSCIAGGICGVAQGKNSNSYSIGKIIDVSNIKNTLGECVGTNNIGENVYGLENTITTNSLSSINHKGVKSSNELKGSAGVTLLNNNNDESVWVEDENNINNGYPVLNWQ